jgi:hypothetical protein
MKIRHAPWSRWFKTFYVNGSYAHELQIGSLVIQWFHEPWKEALFFDRLHFWRDRHWKGGKACSTTNGRGPSEDITQTTSNRPKFLGR